VAISEAERQRRIAERCWKIYDLLVRAFTPPLEFHLAFPEQAELAIFSGALQVRAAIDKQHIIDLSEEYELRNRELRIMFYSYILLDVHDHILLRADPLPHHRVDYRKHPLTHFPHHLHDERGRIHSFSGRLEDFVMRAVELLEG
jgi:hypothetical protein